MSTDLHDRTTNATPDPREPEKPKPALSLAQVVGGALAAMTAAALGSRLSVAGTVVGAALASVVAAVAGALYTTSLRRTHDRVTAVWKSRGARPSDTPPDTGTPTWPGLAEATGPTSGPTWDDEAGSADASGEAAPARRRIGWKPVLATALLIFALAAVALTGIELATGQALSGGSGTTVGQVAEKKTAPSSKPSAPASSTATPTPSASSRPSASPSATPTSGPTAEPTPSASAEPSTSAAPTPTPTAGGSTPAPGAAATP